MLDAERDKEAVQVHARVAAAIAALTVVGATATACGSEEPTASGTLAPPGQANGAYTYDQTAAPPGARLTVTSTGTDGGTRVEFRAEGLQPNRAYGVHAHVRPCGATGEAAGPHFQHRIDPVQPSVDPAYANPRNEIWLDLRTDGSGSGTATTEVPFGFAERAPASVVVHERPTATGPGKAGTAGGRVACLTVPFR